MATGEGRRFGGVLGHVACRHGMRYRRYHDFNTMFSFHVDREIYFGYHFLASFSNMPMTLPAHDAGLPNDISDTCQHASRSPLLLLARPRKYTGPRFQRIAWLPALPRRFMKCLHFLAFFAGLLIVDNNTVEWHLPIAADVIAVNFIGPEPASIPS